MDTAGARRAIHLAVVGSALYVAGGCRIRDREEAPKERFGETVVEEPIGDSSYLVVRDIWIGLADDPSGHMREARELLEEGEPLAAARVLDKSASLFRWGRHYALGEKEGRDFLAVAQELEETARFIRAGSEHGAEPLYRVLANGYRVLAEHHAGLAIEEWNAGEHVRVAILLRAAATEIERGFALSEEAPGGTIDASIAATRGVAEQLEVGEPPTEREVTSALRGLREAAAGLGEVLGSRRT